MALTSNQFRLELVKGVLDQIGNTQTHPAKISSSESGTLTPATAVKISDEGGKLLPVEEIAASTDRIDGFCVYNTRKNEFEADDRIEIARTGSGSIIVMEASGSITRGKKVEYAQSTKKISVAAGTNTIIGTLLDDASADGDLVRVELNVPSSNTIGLYDSLYVTNDLTVGGDGSVGGDLTVDGNAIKSVTNKATGDTTVPITHDIVTIETGGAESLTLADGAEGQVIELIMITDGGAGTLTPDNFGNGSTLTFDDVGDSARLVFVNSAWYSIGTATATIA